MGKKQELLDKLVQLFDQKKIQVETVNSLTGLNNLTVFRPAYIEVESDPMFESDLFVINNVHAVGNDRSKSVYVSCNITSIKKIQVSGSMAQIFIKGGTIIRITKG